MFTSIYYLNFFSLKTKNRILNSMKENPITEELSEKMTEEEMRELVWG